MKKAAFNAQKPLSIGLYLCGVCCALKKMLEADNRHRHCPRAAAADTPRELLGAARGPQEPCVWGQDAGGPLLSTAAAASVSLLQQLWPSMPQGRDCLAVYKLQQDSSDASSVLELTLRAVCLASPQRL